MMYMGLLTLGLMLALPLLQCGKVMEYQDSDQLGHQQEMIEQPQKKWDRYGYGFGSDGFLYDFVKRAPKSQYVRRIRSSPYRPPYRRYNYGFGSDGYLYDFVRK